MTLSEARIKLELLRDELAADGIAMWGYDDESIWLGVFGDNLTGSTYIEGSLQQVLATKKHTK